MNETDSLTPEEWLKGAPSHPDSWWPKWQRWLAERSDPQQQPARPIDAMRAAAQSELEDAPGRYVRE
jgi:polyhydroxyalkanoate synthase